jgi:hypothetical protein
MEDTRMIRRISVQSMLGMFVVGGLNLKSITYEKSKRTNK